MVAGAKSDRWDITDIPTFNRCVAHEVTVDLRRFLFFFGGGGGGPFVFEPSLALPAALSILGLD